MALRLRVLLIEDDYVRIEKIRAWLPSDVILVEARSAGQAMGFLKRLRPGELSGLMLDHDLHKQALTSSDLQLSGTDLLNLIARHLDQNVSILVHSMNPTGAERMSSRLKASGYSVTRTPMAQLDQTILEAWIEDIRDLHDQ